MVPELTFIEGINTAIASQQLVTNRDNPEPITTHNAVTVMMELGRCSV